MNNIKKDWKFYLISFFSVTFFAALPELLLSLTSPNFRIDFMYEVLYCLAFFVLFLVSLVLFFFGFGKEKIKNRKAFLIYYSLLFLATLYVVAYWLGWIVDSIFHSPNFMSL
jgi:hypothetical protein